MCRSQALPRSPPFVMAVACGRWPFDGWRRDSALNVTWTSHPVRLEKRMVGYDVLFESQRLWWSSLGIILAYGRGRFASARPSLEVVEGFLVAGLLRPWDGDVNPRSIVRGRNALVAPSAVQSGLDVVGFLLYASHPQQSEET